MSLHDRVQTDITAAMRGGDLLRRDVLRMVSNAAYNIEKKQGRPLTDDEYLAVLTRERRMAMAAIATKCARFWKCWAGPLAMRR